MHIQSLKLPKEFQRFADLAIRNIPAEARFVILLGPHGSGKSAVLDAIGLWHARHSGRGQLGGMRTDPEYLYRDSGGTDPKRRFREAEISFHEPQPEERTLKRIVHQRSGYRYTKDVKASSIGGIGPIEQEPYVDSMSDTDSRVLKNYQRLVSGIFADVFDEKDKNVDEVKQRHLGPLNDALQIVFPDLTIRSFGRPPINGTFFFKKGADDTFVFKNLSAGEREVFDLLLDAYVVGKEGAAHIVCIDEPEVHMSIESQSRLLPALDALLPQDTQLWLATHSPGIMSYARKAAKERPGSFCFLDLGLVDPTLPQTLEPVAPGGRFWDRVLSYVLGDLVGSVGPEKVVLCEGEPVTGKAGHHGFDQRVYARVFADQLPDLVFVSVGSGSQIERGKALVATISLDADVVGLYDRNGKSEEEIRRLKSRGDRVLNRREIENYLLNDEILAKLVETVIPSNQDSDKQNRVQKLAEILRKPRTNTANDDVKARAKELFDSLNDILPELEQTGSNPWYFMSDVLAPLVKPGTEAYRELHDSLVGIKDDPGEGV